MEVDLLRSPRNVCPRIVYARGLTLPPVSDIERAAEVLNSGKRVAILAGRGAIGAADELETAAERLGAPIVKALLGKGAVPDDSPYTTGGIGLLGTKPSQEALENCDTLLMVGTPSRISNFFPARDKHVPSDRNRSHAHRPEISRRSRSFSDSRCTLRALLPT
jgi:pyruvate dehydrogenase (quinone)/pyruvate oxidase